MRSAAGQTTSEPSSPVDPPQSFHRHTGSDPALPLPSKSITPPSKFHHFNRGRAGGVHTPVKVNGGISRVDRYQSEVLYTGARRGTPSKKHPPMPKEQTDAYLRTKMR
ncbi:hypothetical protein BT96DRAFT_545082 [Gymnopus androsaceus JB14]|uniref:Uncharacterized protein n=1 Tax=Gymnopus androsaceus JB14 TaxID=1447944 RepID=A0A6A4GLE1_9AGAR|nr:hypothetical protein BT96DRAFT_545082 [Gymnopus androsaceus JB14]